MADISLEVKPDWERAETLSRTLVVDTKLLDKEVGLKNFLSTWRGTKEAEELIEELEDALIGLTRTEFGAPDRFVVKVTATKDPFGVEMAGRYLVEASSPEEAEEIGLRRHSERYQRIPEGSPVPLPLTRENTMVAINRVGPEFRQGLTFGQGPKPGELGRAVGAAGATAAVTAAGAPILIPVAAPIGAAVGEAAETEVRKRVDSGRSSRMSRWGQMAEYGAVFAGREAASNLARLYQVNGFPSFVVFNPSRYTFDPLTKAPVKGAWVVEIGEPADFEKADKKVAPIPIGEKLPPDPKKEILLEFPAAIAEVAFSQMERPTLLDVLVESEFGASFLPGAAEKAPCECAENPRTKKLTCNREGATGSLKQEQIPTRCSTVEVTRTDGRIRRHEALREAQAICGELVKDIQDPGERQGQRITCLTQSLTARGIAF